MGWKIKGNGARCTEDLRQELGAISIDSGGSMIVHNESIIRLK